MPLIIMCGIPSSGKSLRASQLNEYFSSERKSLVITDENIGSGSGLRRNDVFSDLHKEKQLRSALKSEVHRHISRDTVVILDAANYIKGYRYELYCLTKGSKTTCCVVHCDVLSENSWSFNMNRSTEQQYSREMFEALLQRFEAPDSRNRWDSPLFTIHIDEKLPFQKIDDALFLRKAPPPNLSTQCQPLSSTNFLYDLDRITQDIVQAAIEGQKRCSVGDTLSVPGAAEKINYFHPLFPVELTRLRRQFLLYTKSHPVKSIERIPDMFVKYINSSNS